MSNMVAQMKRELEPGSLRLGLFDVVHDTGGAEAEALLAHELSQTGRGLEVAYLDRILSDIAEGQYKEQVLTLPTICSSPRQPPPVVAYWMNLPARFCSPFW